MAKTGITGRKKIKGFLTKYALSAGIQEVEVELDPDGDPGGKYVWVPMPGVTYRNMVPRSEFHEKRADAEKAQKSKAKLAILRLEKQILKLQEIIVKPRYARVSK